MCVYIVGYEDGYGIPKDISAPSQDLISVTIDLIWLPGIEYDVVKTVRTPSMLPLATGISLTLESFIKRDGKFRFHCVLYLNNVFH